MLADRSWTPALVASTKLEKGMRAMGKQLEVGKSYYPMDHAFDPVKVIKRSPKCVVVRNWSGSTWRMLVKTDKDGVEYVTDSCVPMNWRYSFTYSADNPGEEV